KQASFLVWQLKEAKCGPDAIMTQAEKLSDPSEKAFFEQSIEKYKRVMGVA
ncbi:pyridoxamine 5-phosphate oxidase, partial [Vibrio sp. 03_296]